MTKKKEIPLVISANQALAAFLAKAGEEDASQELSRLCACGIVKAWAAREETWSGRGARLVKTELPRRKVYSNAWDFLAPGADQDWEGGNFVVEAESGGILLLAHVGFCAQDLSAYLEKAGALSEFPVLEDAPTVEQWRARAPARNADRLQAAMSAYDAKKEAECLTPDDIGEEYMAIGRDMLDAKWWPGIDAAMWIASRDMEKVALLAGWREFWIDQDDSSEAGTYESGVRACVDSIVPPLLGRDGLRDAVKALQRKCASGHIRWQGRGEAWDAEPAVITTERASLMAAYPPYAPPVKTRRDKHDWDRIFNAAVGVANDLGEYVQELGVKALLDGGLDEWMQTHLAQVPSESQLYEVFKKWKNGIPAPPYEVEYEEE